MKRYKCTNKRRLFTVVTILMFLVLSLASLVQTKPADARTPVDIIYATVEKGDSLWLIAERYDDNKMDLREYIYLIRAFNDLDSTVLQPGQKIRVPVY